jgi:E-phenylitaconyl-CoA hydratase
MPEAAIDLSQPQDGVLYEKRGHIAYITLNRPDRGNAIIAPMRSALKAMWQDVKSDPHVRCVILTGAGSRHFCTGADAAPIVSTGKIPAMGKKPLHDEFFLTSRANQVWKPTVLAVNGLVAGGGLHFVADADIIVAADHVKFMDFHTNIGMVGAMENIGLAKRMPLGSALRLTLCGGHYRMTAKRAHQLGLVDELVPADDLMSTAEEIAQMICRNSPEANSLSMQAVWSAMEMGYTQAAEYGWSLLRMHWSHPDFKEGPRAYAEKREPQWHVDTEF